MRRNQNGCRRTFPEDELDVWDVCCERFRDPEADGAGLASCASASRDGEDVERADETCNFERSYDGLAVIYRWAVMT